VAGHRAAFQSSNWEVGFALYISACQVRKAPNGKSAFQHFLMKNPDFPEDLAKQG
jgi:hypothetical protein